MVVQGADVRDGCVFSSSVGLPSKLIVLDVKVCAFAVGVLGCGGGNLHAYPQPALGTRGIMANTLEPWQHWNRSLNSLKGLV